MFRVHVDDQEIHETVIRLIFTKEIADKILDDEIGAEAFADFMLNQPAQIIASSYGLSLILLDEILKCRNILATDLRNRGIHLIDIQHIREEK